MKSESKLGHHPKAKSQSIQSKWVKIKSIWNQHDMGHPARLFYGVPRAVRREPTFLVPWFNCTGVSRGLTGNSVVGRRRAVGPLASLRADNPPFSRGAERMGHPGCGVGGVRVWGVRFRYACDPDSDRQPRESAREAAARCVRGQCAAGCGLVAIEGETLIEEALRSGLTLKTVFVSERREARGGCRARLRCCI